MNYKLPVSVILPVKNEELNIRKCLESLNFAEEIFVVDSSSTDKTIEIAKEYTDKIYNFEYKGEWPKKKGWAIENLPFKNQWIFLIDADEVVPPELVREIELAIRKDAEYDAFFINRKFIFLGKWIKYCGWYPSWNIRVFKKDKVHFERLRDEEDTLSGDVEVHEHLVVNGKVGYLKTPLIHEDRKGIYGFIEKHNRYSSWEANVYMNLKNKRAYQGIKPKLFGTPIERKRFFKTMWVRVPFRPVFRFLYMYFLKLGFLDKYPGFIFSFLMSYHEAMINAKIREKKLERNAK